MPSTRLLAAAGSTMTDALAPDTTISGLHRRHRWRRGDGDRDQRRHPHGGEGRRPRRASARGNRSARPQARRSPPTCNSACRSRRSPLGCAPTGDDCRRGDVDQAGARSRRPGRGSRGRNSAGAPIGSAWVLTRALSPVRVPLPEPPPVLQRHFPGRCCRSASPGLGLGRSTPRSGPTAGSARSRQISTPDGGWCSSRIPPTERPRATLRRALQASCAIPGLYPPVRVDGARLVDGGLRSATNLDVAARLPSRAVLAISAITFDPADPPSGPGRLLRMWPNRTVLREVSYLRRLGHEVLLLRPGRMALELAGTTLFSGRITSDIVEAAYEGAVRRLALPTCSAISNASRIAAQASSAA